MQTKRTLAMKYRHRQFLKLYLGHTPIAGNATQCYKAVFGDHLPERSAQQGGSRLLQLDHIKAAIEKAEQLALKELAVDAQFVLEQNVRLYNRAMGDDSYDHVEVDTDPATGLERVSVIEKRSYDPATAHKALTSIGQHKDIQAFSLTVEHNHTHHLEQRLAARSKLIEGKAQAIDAEQLLELAQPGQPPHLKNEIPGQPTDQAQSAQVLADPRGAAAAGADPSQVDAPAGHRVPGDNDQQQGSGPADGRGTPEAPADAQGPAKRVHRAEVTDDRAHERERSPAEREGATA